MHNQISSVSNDLRSTGIPSRSLEKVPGKPDVGPVVSSILDFLHSEWALERLPEKSRTDR